MKKNETEILEFINNLKGYQGYIQMSDKPITDIWQNFSDISLVPSSGFVYEAHFWSEMEKTSIAIRQINDGWLVDKNKNVPLGDTQTYYTKFDKTKARMAQIWVEESDPLCENMSVMKLKKVVFAGFEGEKQ